MTTLSNIHIHVQYINSKWVERMMYKVQPRRSEGRLSSKRIGSEPSPTEECWTRESAPCPGRLAAIIQTPGRGWRRIVRGGQPGSTGLPLGYPGYHRKSHQRGRGESEGSSTVGRRGTRRGERFFWWRTPCNTWQYLVSGLRSPAGSTLFYSIRGAAIRFSAPRIHSSVAAACGSTGDTRPPWGPPPRPCTPARRRPDPLACLQE